MSRFTGMNAVITGAGSGIGKATAKRLAEEGARVLMVGRTESKLRDAADDINGQLGSSQADLFTADATKEADVETLVEAVKQKYGAIHVLINNAGGSSHSSIFDTSIEQWDKVQEINLKSVFLVSKVIGKFMVETAKEGAETRANRSIVNTASLSAHQSGAKIPHYSAAKSGVINLTRSLALEMAPYGIRVNSVSPGFVETPLTEPGLENEKFSKSIERNTALGRIGQPEEIANTIAFVASPEASYMTGSDILVDGGWLIK